MLNKITERLFCQARVMLSFFSLFFVRWVHFIVFDFQ